MGRASLREQILQAGLPVMFRSGYHAASVRDICAAAHAPQGSFTNHFRSKEAFSVEVLDRYFDYLKKLVSETLNDETLTPRQRLKQYLDVITKKLERDRWMLGCLVGDLSLQASSHSNLLRRRLDAIFREWRKLFASCIAAAQSAGEIDSQFVSRLQAVGEWMSKYGDSIYGTRGGPIAPGEWGVTTQKDNKIYVHVLNWNAPLLALSPISNKVTAAHLLVGGAAVEFTQNSEGLILKLPSAKNDETDRVVVLTVTKTS